MKLILETEPTRQLSNGEKKQIFFSRSNKQNTTKVLGHYDDLNEDSPNWLIDLIWSPESGWHYLKGLKAVALLEEVCHLG